MNPALQKAFDEMYKMVAERYDAEQTPAGRQNIRTIQESLMWRLRGDKDRKRRRVLASSFIALGQDPASLPDKAPVDNISANQRGYGILAAFDRRPTIFPDNLDVRNWRGVMQVHGAGYEPFVVRVQGRREFVFREGPAQGKHGVALEMLEDPPPSFKEAAYSAREQPHAKADPEIPKVGQGPRQEGASVKSKPPLSLRDQLFREVKTARPPEMLYRALGFRAEAINRIEHKEGSEPLETNYAAELLLGNYRGNRGSALFNGASEEEQRDLDLLMLNSLGAAFDSRKDCERRTLPPDVVVSVNVSPGLLHAETDIILKFMAGVVAACGSDWRRVVFELPESMNDTNDIDIVRALHGRRDGKVFFALDDLGSRDSAINDHCIKELAKLGLIWLKYDWKYFQGTRVDESQRDTLKKQLHRMATEHPHLYCVIEGVEGVREGQKDRRDLAEIAKEARGQCKICIQGWNVNFMPLPPGVPVPKAGARNKPNSR